MKTNENVQNIIEKAFQDQITELLLKKSNLTKIQFETFIIDVLTDVLSDNRVSFQEKTLFRDKKVSRGAFSRTLGQARKRVISSIFTIILLSYVGVFDTKPFNEYEILAEKLREYIFTIKNIDLKSSKQLLRRIEEELTEGINSLSKPTSLKEL